MTRRILVQTRHVEEEVLLQLRQWISTAEVTGQYVEHPRSLRLLWNYLKRIGFRAVLWKLRSRLSEAKRNRKIAGVGLGDVIEAPVSHRYLVNRRVVFFAPNANPLSKVLVVDKNLVVDLSKVRTLSEFEEPIGQQVLHGDLKKYAGWNRVSGRAIDPEVIVETLQQIGLSKRVKDEVHDPVKGDIGATICVYGRGSAGNTKPTAVLFGLGNYAKTAILPNIRKYIQVQRVHEIDPDQFAFLNSARTIDRTTSPVPLDEKAFDAWFIAGFHHTHTDLAIQAFEQDSVAVIEKPLATNREQYARFEAALQQLDGKFFLCFHKRYSRLHDWALQDLQANSEDGVDMHCIVYEIPLPPLHWYNWPNSGSRLVSNGCHWIDYFLFVNRYVPVVKKNVWVPRGSDVCVQILLENGAYFSMTLTDSGSQRLGVREHMELRKGGTTVTMIDASSYRAENRSRVFRHKRINPLSTYAQMYGEIGRAIVSSSPGDSRESLASSELTLLLEDQVRAERGDS